MNFVEYAIIGAGICGCSVAHFLSGNNILLIDKNGICEGASASAGAFLSPIVGKTNKIKLLVDEALPFSVDFYKSLKLESFIQNGLLKLPRDENDILKFDEYEKFIKFNYSKKDDGFFFEIGAIVSPKEVCLRLSQNVNFLKKEVKNIKYIDDYWLIDNEIKAKNLILTIGFEEILDLEYIKLRPVFGQKIDIKTTTKIPYNIHKNLSISTTKNNNLVSIGATHERFKTDGKVNKEVSLKLIKEAKEMFNFSNEEIISEFCGVRAGSIDFMPIVGEVINASETLNKYPYIKNGVRIKDFINYKNLYILNGVGGRGFVLAPFLGKILSEFLIDKKEIHNDLNSIRLFYKWARKNN